MNFAGRKLTKKLRKRIYYHYPLYCGFLPQSFFKVFFYPPASSHGLFELNLKRYINSHFFSGNLRGLLLSASAPEWRGLISSRFLLTPHFEKSEKGGNGRNAKVRKKQTKRKKAKKKFEGVPVRIRKKPSPRDQFQCLYFLVIAFSGTNRVSNSVLICIILGCVNLSSLHLCEPARNSIQKTHKTTLLRKNPRK